MAKILVVEDNEMNMDMLTRRLTKRGHNVISAMDGLAGLELVHSQHPDLILMDMSLPELDGWEATRRIKADPNTRMIPVIALTAHAMSEDRDKALAAGCDEYETKPVRMANLMVKINALLGIEATEGDE
jgi:CheY-like chemotaxis protein